MRVLSFDTALTACSVAVVDTAGDSVLAARSEHMDRGHAEALMPMIAAEVEKAGGLEGIERIVVTVGPGSFTGIRVGLAAARALALATEKPLVGVTTLSALAAPAIAEDGDTPVVAAIDARHGRVFFQAFTPGARGLVPARVLPAREAARSLGAGAVRLIGSGAGLVAEHLEAGRYAILDGVVADPVWLARLGAVMPLPMRPPRPLYLRPADAKPQTGGRVARA